jgi:putative ABC transport system permease protein
LLLATAPGTIPRLGDVAIDGRVLTFAVLASLVAGVASSLVSSVVAQQARRNLVSRTAGATRTAPGRRVRQAAVVAEIALALLVAVAAGLMLRSFQNVRSLPLGYDPGRVISIGLNPQFPTENRAAMFAMMGQFERDVLERVRALPGVVAAGTGSAPLGGGSSGLGYLLTLPDQGDKQVPFGADAVSRGFLETLGAHVVQGRFFDDRDVPSSPRVAVVNEVAVRELWPDMSPVGKTISADGAFEIVGVVSNIRRLDLEKEPAPTVYFTTSQLPNVWTNNLLIRTAGDPMDVLPAVRAAVNDLDRGQALSRIETLAERLDRAKAPRRFLMRLSGTFALIALGLAMLGVYGVVAESVASRVPEIGVRVAFGATPGRIVGMVLREGIVMAGSGVILGLGIALLLRDAATALIFGVTATDLVTWTASAAGLGAAALSGCAIPARRAATIDPMRALRTE